jgi:uncharacterized cupredoxin-like copper-binding protein
MRRTGPAFVVLAIITAALGGCGGGDDEPETAAPEEPTTVTTAEPSGTGARTIAITGQDYAFEVPATIEGGLIEISFTNAGKEAHFAGLAKVAEGKTFDDVKAVLTAPPPGTPPSGPPPFEEFAGAATVDPGLKGNATFNLPAGSYALFCALPAPDGVPHAAKGMITPLTVTEGIAAALPDVVTSLAASDFALAGSPPTKGGTTVVGIRNQGKQLHEINLVELMPDKKMEDVVAWFKQPAGPPPMSFRSGVAVKPGEEGTSSFELKSGSDYAFLCAVPDALGDFAPHVVKGMYTPAFTVT